MPTLSPTICNAISGTPMPEQSVAILSRRCAVHQEGTVTRWSQSSIPDITDNEDHGDTEQENDHEDHKVHVVDKDHVVRRHKGPRRHKDHVDKDHLDNKEGCDAAFEPDIQQEIRLSKASCR